MILVFVCITLVAYWIGMEHIRISKLNEKLKHFPGTNLTIPILGDIHVWASANWSINEKVNNFFKVMRNYPTTLKVWFGPKVVIVVNNPDDIKTVLSSPYCINKSSIYRLSIGGDSLFIANDDKWKVQRRNLNSAFSPRVLKSYEYSLNQFGRNLVEALKDNVSSKQEFDITRTLGTYSVDLFTRTIFGSTRHKLKLAQNCYELTHSLMLWWGKRIVQINFQFLTVLVQKLFRITSEDKKFMKELRSELQPIFDEKIEEYHNHLKSSNNNEDDSKPENFLDKLTRLRFEETIGMTEYRHTRLNIFFAGTETTAYTMSIIILMLAIHEEYQQMIYDEISQFVKSNGDGDIDISHLSQLNLLDRFIKETLRLFPTVVMLGRLPSRDIRLSEGILPAGTEILISIVNLHQQPEIWGDDANKFNPDHFLPEAVAKRKPCTFLPFSYGPRNCIGYKFAQMSMVIGLFHLLKNYQLKTKLKFEDIKIGYGLTSMLLIKNLISIQPREPIDS